MLRANRMATLALLTASVLITNLAQADGITSYRIVDLGWRNDLTSPSWPTIDNSGNLVNFNQRTRDIAGYQLGSVPDSKNQGQLLYNYLYAQGSSVNLLPQALQDPNQTIIAGVNSSGLVAGMTSEHPFIYSVVAGQYLAPPQLLPGGATAPVLQGINNAGQIIANDNVPTLYTSPSAAPIPLIDLLPTPTAWKLLTVSDINDNGDIVGEGINPSGQDVDYELIPLTAPEPSVLALLCVGVGACVGRRVWTRRFQSL